MANEKILIIKDWSGNLYVHQLPTEDGAVSLPDRYWGWAVYGCKDFGPEIDNNNNILKNGKIKCHDKDIPEWWDKELISEGTLNYSASDIAVEDRIGFKSKYLHVSETFNIGASIYREAKIEGFGLWIDKDGAGFSWEWFTRKKGNIYRKLQESGSVFVEFREIEGLQEIESIEFLEDVSMRLDTLNIILFWNKETHRMLIKKGSKLVFLPPTSHSNIRGTDYNHSKSSLME